MEAGSFKPPKFVCEGRTFESSSSLANFLGVTKGAISHAKCEAKEKGRQFFECGKPVKRYIRILEAAFEEDGTTVSPSKYVGNSRLLPAHMLGIKMKTLQVQGHMQAAAVKVFPGKNLRMPTHDVAAAVSASISIAVITTEDLSYTLFDVAEMWMFYSPASASSLQAFRQSLLGSGQYGMAPELNVQNYPSLMFAVNTGTTASYMLAEDVIKFLVSPFARKRPYNALFDDEMDTVTESGVGGCCDTADDVQGDGTQPPSYSECMSWESTARGSTRAEEELMQTCRNVMHDVNTALRKRRTLEALPADSLRTHKRQLAAAAVYNVTTLLLAASSMLYSEAGEP